MPAARYAGRRMTTDAMQMACSIHTMLSGSTGRGVDLDIAVNRVGILAYGSLLTDPGSEIAAVIQERIPAETPFEIEYARSSNSRAGAPTLVPVPEGKGARVKAKILVLKPEIGLQAAADMLYRKEINKVADRDALYHPEEQLGRKGHVQVLVSDDFDRPDIVLYTYIDPNISLVLREDVTIAEKAQHLARLAIESVRPDTYSADRDGIQYLADAINSKVLTPLTEPYRRALLALAGGTTDLEDARKVIARRL
jgi:hypothetical protein